MARLSGITSSSPTRILIDSGAVYKNYGEGNEALLGVTRGGSEFKIAAEVHDMNPDGAIGKVKGFQRIVNVEVSLTVNFMEMSQTLWLLMNPGATAADYPVAPATKTHDLITRTVDISDASYATNIAIVGNSTYSTTGYIICKLLNVLSNAECTVGFNPKDESVIPVTFYGHFDPSTISTEPWEIYNPVIG